MFKNILLSIFSIFLILALIEFVIGPIWLKNQHDMPDKASYEFYKKYYKELHHLRGFRSWYYQNGLMFTKISSEDVINNRSTVLINGDSWAENLVVHAFGSGTNKIVTQELLKIEKEKNINIVVSGTGSYSFSLTTAQLKVLRRDFNIHPDKIITMIDHTDVGDEICRYKDKIELNSDGSLNRVRPEDLYSSEVYNVRIYLTKVGNYISDDWYITKFINNRKFKKKVREKKVGSMVCGFSNIMRPVINGLDKDEYIYLEEVTLRYINEVFSDKNVKKLLLVVHPHIKHFTGEYKFYFADFLKDILPKSKFKNQITVLDFKKEFYNTYFEGDVTKNFEDVFLVEDKSSHLKINARIPYVKKSFEKLFE